MTVLAHRLENPSLEQGCNQFIDGGLRAADAAGDIVGAQWLADFLEEIEDIERPVQPASPALDGVFGHVSGFPFKFAGDITANDRSHAPAWERSSVFRPSSCTQHNQSQPCNRPSCSPARRPAPG